VIQLQEGLLEISAGIARFKLVKPAHEIETNTGVKARSVLSVVNSTNLVFTEARISLVLLHIDCSDEM